MNRMTEQHYKKSTGYYMKCSEYCEREETACFECERSDEIVDRLGRIEDILGEEYDLDRLRELVDADRDGRCVVLSESMKPMVQHAGDTDVYCPACGHTLSGGWPMSDADDYRKMCQCPNCGQSIDDGKCVVEAAEAALKEIGHQK